MEPKNNFVKIYYADIAPLKNEALFSIYFNEMKRERQEKIIRAGTEKGKIHLLSSGVILKKILEKDFKDFSRLSWDNISFTYGENGKPYIKNDMKDDIKNIQIFFNISHSADRVMCAISNIEVGCDVEKIKDAKLSVAKRFFSYEEISLIENCDENEKNGLFYSIWTKKESMAKLTGNGIKDISNAFTLPYCNIDGKPIMCKALQLEEDYCYSVALYEMARLFGEKIEI